MYGRELGSSTMDVAVDDEEYSGELRAEKKRRLGAKQVKALEKYFEIDNKLEPDRKVKVAQEIGLQPRQVAIWFQNRRARWKTKQLERDYGVLKAHFDSLQHDYDSLRHHNQTLLKQITELKEKLNGENKVTVKEEAMESFSDEKDNNPKPSAVSTTELIIKLDDFRDGNASNIFAEFKDWSPDSDSSAVSGGGSINSVQFPDIIGDSFDSSHFVKIEERNFKSFHWCGPEDWDWEDES